MRIRIIEECLGVNRRNGQRSTGQTDDRAFAAVVGSVMEMPAGRRKFTVDSNDANSITVTVHYENNPSSNKTWVIAKGASVIYRPRSSDGGYKYTIIYEDES